MIEEQGRVVAVGEEGIWVQTVRESACTACSARKACGQKLLNGAASARARQFQVAATLAVRVGDEVVVGIPESALLKASVLLYLIPLVLMIAGAALAQLLVGNQDGWIALGGAAGLAAGLALAQGLSRRRATDDHFQPRLLRRLPDKAPAIPLEVTPCQGARQASLGA